MALKSSKRAVQKDILDWFVCSFSKASERITLVTGGLCLSTCRAAKVLAIAVLLCSLIVLTGCLWHYHHPPTAVISYKTCLHAGAPVSVSVSLFVFSFPTLQCGSRCRARLAEEANLSLVVELIPEPRLVTVALSSRCGESPKEAGIPHCHKI